MGKSRNNAIFAGFVTSSAPSQNDSLLFTGDKFVYTDTQVTDELTVTESIDGKITIKEVFTSSIQSIPDLTVLGNVYGSPQFPEAIVIETDISSSVIPSHNTVATAKSIQEYVSSSVSTISNVSSVGRVKRWTENEISGRNISTCTNQKRIWITTDNRIVGNGYTSYHEFNNYHTWAWREGLHLPDNEVPAKVYAGYYHITVLSESGKLYFAGRNVQNMFSTTDPQHFDYRQSQLLRGFLSDDGNMDDVKFTKVAFPVEHYPSSIIALTDSGSVYTAGVNEFGQLGTGDLKNTYGTGVNGQISSTPIWDGSTTKAIDVAQMGQWNGTSYVTTTVILTEDNLVRTCGYGGKGQCGTGGYSNENPNLSVVETSLGVDLQDVKEILVYGHDKNTGCFAITDNGGGSGSLYGWGHGANNLFGFDPITNDNQPYATKLGNAEFDADVLQVYRGYNNSANEPTFVKCTNTDYDGVADKRRFRWYGAGKNNEKMITTTRSANANLPWMELDDTIFTSTDIDVHTMWYGIGVTYQAHFVIATNYQGSSPVEELYVIGTTYDGNAGLGRAPWDTYSRENIPLSGWYTLGWVKVPLESSVVEKIIQINCQEFNASVSSRTTEIITSDGDVYFAGRDAYSFNSSTYGDHYNVNFTKVRDI